jgi:hypothetical protein
VTAGERIIRWSTAGAVLGTAVVAAVVSYEHASALVRAHGESGWSSRLFPLTVDGLIYASSMAMLDSARRGIRTLVLARCCTVFGTEDLQASLALIANLVRVGKA